MSDYVTQLNDFSSLIRNPSENHHLDNDKISLYHSLVKKNLDSVISPCFPVLKQIIPKEIWKRLISELLAQHQLNTPLFYKAPLFLVNLLNNHPLPNYPFAASLAHYEWIELELELLDVSCKQEKSTYDREIYCYPLKLSEHARLLRYDYDVHNICNEYIPTTKSCTYLIVYVLHGEIQFTKISEINYQLLTYLFNEKVSAKETVAEICKVNPDVQKDSLTHEIHSLLNLLYYEGVIDICGEKNT